MVFSKGRIPPISHRRSRAENNIEADVGGRAEAERATVVDVGDPCVRGRARSSAASGTRASSTSPGEAHSDVESSHTREVATVPSRVGVGKVALEAGAADAIDALVCVGLADHDAGWPVFSDTAG